MLTLPMALPGWVLGARERTDNKWTGGPDTARERVPRPGRAAAVYGGDARRPPSPGIGFGGPDPASDVSDIQHHILPGIHGLFDEPVVRYPSGSRSHFGFNLTFVVNADGTVACASIEPPFGEAGPTLTDERKTFLDTVTSWRFAPYAIAGHATAVVETQRIAEEDMPAHHVDAPVGDVSQVTITLDDHPEIANSRLTTSNCMVTAVDLILPFHPAMTYADDDYPKRRISFCSG